MGLSFSDFIKTCCYSDKEQFHNYDSSVVNEPLLGIWRPSEKFLTLQSWIESNCGRNSPLIAGLLSEYWPWIQEEATRLSTPCSPSDQISALVHLAYREGLRARVVGTGASWSGVTKCQDIMIETTALNQIMSDKPGLVWCDRDKKTYSTVTVQSGMLVKDFCAEIDARFTLALPVLGNYAGQTVGGLVATSSHGSSKHCMTMANYVHSLYFVTEGGVKIKVRYQQPNEQPTSLSQTSTLISQQLQHFDPFHEPIEIISDQIIHSAIVSLGCFGVVYALEFYCEAAYDIAEIRTSLEISEENLDKTRGLIELPRIIKDGFGLDNESNNFNTIKPEKDPNFFFSFFVNPITTENNTIRCTVLQGSKRARKLPEKSEDIISQSKTVVNLRTDTCKCPLCWMTCGTVCERRGLNTTIQLIQKDISAACLHTASIFGTAAMRREATTFAMYGFEHSITRIDKWFEILQITKGHIHIRTAEWCVPLSELERALYEVVTLSRKHCERYGTSTSLLPLFVRCMKADSLPLSMANCRRTDSKSDTHYYAFIELPFLPGSYGTDEYHQMVESVMASKFNARPHWAKNNFLNSAVVHQIYPSITQWQTVESVFNQSGTFSNVFSDQCGLTSSRLNSVKVSQPSVSNGTPFSKPHQSINIGSLACSNKVTISSTN